MQPEVSKFGEDKEPRPPMQEVEFALILARMINTVKEDPVQLRVAVYEFARAKLHEEISWADDQERERLLNAFETAIRGVEDFSSRGDVKEPLRLSVQSELGPSANPSLPGPGYMPTGPMNPAAIALKHVAAERQMPPTDNRQTRALMSLWIRLAAGMLVVCIVAGVAVYAQRGFLLSANGKAPPSATATPGFSAEQLVFSQSMQSAATKNPTPNIAVSQQPAFPLPGVYGVYALNNGTLSELDVLAEQVPDKRVAMSTPVTAPSRTVVSDGNVKFIVFRRDLASNAPDRIDVRVVARVTRAIRFDSKGQRSLVPVTDAWNIRNIAHEFRVKPIPANPEMLLVQPENADFKLPPGRYVLALKNQGYDFTVTGEQRDPAQCLERTEAANGIFYSECQR